MYSSFSDTRSIDDEWIWVISFSDECYLEKDDTEFGCLLFSKPAHALVFQGGFITVLHITSYNNPWTLDHTFQSPFVFQYLSSIILLMEEIRLTSWYGKYPMIYRVLAPSQVVLAGFLNHQQWNHSQFHLSTVTLETNTFLSHFLQHFSKEKGLMKVHAASTVPMGWNQIFDLPACMTKFAIKNQPFVDSGKFTPVPFPWESVMQVWNPEISSFIARFHCSDLSQIFRKIH